MFKALMRREVILVKRTMFIYYFKTSQIAIMGIIAATLFLRTQVRIIDFFITCLILQNLIAMLTFQCTCAPIWSVVEANPFHQGGDSKLLQRLFM